MSAIQWLENEKKLFKYKGRLNDDPEGWPRIQPKNDPGNKLELIRKTKRCPQRDLQDLRREAEKAQALSHPNIAPIRRPYMWENDRQEPDWLNFILYTEYVLGGSLARFALNPDANAAMSGQPKLSLRHMWVVFHQLGSALVHCHVGVNVGNETLRLAPRWSGPVLHRKIKLENILIQEHGDKIHVKLCDFGLINERSLLPAIGESESGWPPEALSFSEWTTKTDIWCLGDTLKRIQLEETPPNQLAILLGQCVNEHPETRPSAVKLLSNIRQILSPNRAAARITYTAIRASRHEVLKRLHELGEDIKDVNFEGDSALHYAARLGQVSFLEMFRTLDFDLELAFTNDFKSPLFCAAEHGEAAAFNYLRKQTQNPTFPTLLDGRTVMHAAAATGGLDMVKYLQELGVPLNVKTIDDTTPLHEAAAAGNADVVEYMLLEDTPCCVTRSGYTVLHAAAQGGLIGWVANLVKYRFLDIRATTNNRETALHFAARAGQLEMVRHLVETGSEIGEKVDPAARTRDGKAAIAYAYEGGSREVVRYLSGMAEKMDVTGDDRRGGDAAVEYLKRVSGLSQGVS